MRTLTTELAPAKLNLCLFLGPVRGDGRHELATVFDSLTLFDGIEVVAASADEVVCDAVQGTNLVETAISGLRARGWDAPPVSVRIRKRIPVAAGMGGGSSDAAAMLRLAPRLAPVDEAALAEIAATLGADVPGQLRPGSSLATGAGEVVRPLAAFASYGVLVLPQPFGLSSADVYREADRLGLPRSSDELASLTGDLEAELIGAATPVLPERLATNDLERAALSLEPDLAEVLRITRETGADRAMVCGSGPTVVGIFQGRDGADRARAAAERLAPSLPGAVAAEPVLAGGNP
ncbi:MAG: 4-(cytidine 5'-diphospho)-2-C-methyl-D-erythritol kinase [Solirubrobacteraceae bacterium]